MAEFLFKDRVTATPNRIKLTKVAEDTYDVEKIPGEIVEAGTPLNATTMNQLAQKDGTNTALMNTVFTEATTRANIASGETHATLFGKIRKFFADLKPHAFNDLATVQGTETDKAPTNKLLKESTVARVYLTIPDLGLSGEVTTVQVLNAMLDNSLTTLGINSLTLAAGNLHTITDLPAAFGDFVAYKTLNTNASGHRFLVFLSTSSAGGGALYRAVPVTSGMTVTSVAWEQVLSDKNISTVMPLSSAAASNAKVLSEKVVYDELAKKAPLANPTFTGTVTVPTPVNDTDAATKKYVDSSLMSMVIKQPDKTYVLYHATAGTNNLYLSAATYSHTYASAGAYLITISGTGYSATVDWGDGTSGTVDFTGGFNIDEQADKDKYIEVHLGTNCAVIGNGAFSYCFSLTSVTIPNSVTIIGNDAFAGCSGLTFITIPNSVISIGEAAFQNCSGLTSINFMGSTLPTIGSSAFEDCRIADIIAKTSLLADNAASAITTAGGTLLTNYRKLY